MTNRQVRFLVIALMLVALSAGCNREPSEPRVVDAPDETTESPPPAGEPEITPLGEIEITLQPLASGFDQPLYVTSDGTGSGALYVVEKTGRVWVLEDGQRGGQPFLDLSGSVSTTSEQGLLGLAFPPEFGELNTCFVSYTDLEGTSVVSSLSVTNGVADRATETVLLTQPQPYANHNGGMIAFGPDGYLYFGLGDGGSGGDPQGNGQNPDTLLAALLRLDVLGTPGQFAIPPDNPYANGGGRPEIWAIGLRNPWRFSFDRKTGDLWIGDVGQNSWEEIDFQSAASVGGENYGWNVYEGSHAYPEGTAMSPLGPQFAWPVVEYDRQAGKSVTGGYVYRGSSQDVLWGTYFYADFVDGRIWGLQRTADGIVETRLLLDNDMMITSFGEDDDGELYVVDYAGGVYRLMAQ